jgi:hypothetical protein
MTRNYLEEIALELLQQTHGDHHDPFGLRQARLFSISPLHARRLLAEAADVYVAIDAIPCLHATIGEDSLIAIETCGYAAPADGSDEAPSQHPARRRVRLVIVANREGDLGSAMVFSDGPQDPITSSTGAGMLADQLSIAMRRLELVQSLPLNDPSTDSNR